MVNQPDANATSPAAPLVVIAVGNTRTRLGRFEGPELARAESIDNAAADATDRVAAACAPDEAGDPPVVLMASVADEPAERYAGAVDAVIGAGRLRRVGVDVGVPMDARLDDQGVRTVGVDRLLNALGAWQRTQQACVVIDVDTAVTVDFVDGQGAFCGGATAPGLNMMLAALHEHTAKLPALRYEDPGDEAFGVNTAHAMRLGVASAVRGLVRELTERYATAYDAYPQVVATGGDMGVLQHDGVIEHFVPDLQLLGMHAVWTHALSEA